MVVIGGTFSVPIIAPIFFSEMLTPIAVLPVASASASSASLIPIEVILVILTSVPLILLFWTGLVPFENSFSSRIIIIRLVTLVRAAFV